MIQEFFKRPLQVCIHYFIKILKMNVASENIVVMYQTKNENKTLNYVLKLNQMAMLEALSL